MREGSGPRAQPSYQPRGHHAVLVTGLLQYENLLRPRNALGCVDGQCELTVLGRRGNIRSTPPHLHQASLDRVLVLKKSPSVFSKGRLSCDTAARKPGAPMD